MSSATETVEALIIGASGYVGGELLRLLSGHPRLEVSGVVSRSLAGREVVETFPHLAGVELPATFDSMDRVGSLLGGRGPLAVFGAAPHGESAAVLDDVLELAATSDRDVALVDLSADFRLPDRTRYEEVYGIQHGAPGRIRDFTCALPDLEENTPDGPVAHPGCFTTAVSLACAPLQASGQVEPRYAVMAVTGSTGSGRTPSATTHHPERHGNLRAYRPLQHRHAPEMEMLVGRRGGAAPSVAFVPHSGPFARGIHATVYARLAEGASADLLLRSAHDLYHGSPFVQVLDRPPQLKEVVGTNRCALGITVEGRDVVVLSVIDNLVKGAAGGAVQWMNRLMGWDSTTGLTLPAWGWA